MHIHDKIQGIGLSLLGGLTVIIGAFGAHGIKPVVSQEAFERFETGLLFQVMHLLALLMVWSSGLVSHKARAWIFRWFIAGVLLFSGSLYILVFKEVNDTIPSFIGVLTPLGGVCFILGWGSVALGISRNKGI